MSFWPLALPHAVQEPVEVLVVQWTGDRVDVETEQAHHVADDLEVAVVPGDQEQAFVLVHHPFGARCCEIASTDASCAS